MKFKGLISLLLILAPPAAIAILLGWFILRADLLAPEGSIVWFTIWLLGPAVLLAELLFMVSFVLVAILKGPVVLPESQVDEISRTAVIYVVKNEAGRLDTNIRASFNGNRGPGVDFWLLSDQTNDSHCLELEQRIRESLGERLKYYHRDHGAGWKRGMIGEWLRTPEGSTYHFIIICDADTVLPQDTVKAFLKKAAAPENARVAIFQSLIAASRPPRTYFAKWLQPSQETSQRIYVRASQRIFGRGMFFGSSALIRAECYRDIHVPAHALSHDIWDTALLDIRGWKTAFCEDIVTYEQYPNNYLEALRRERRWLWGTLQALLQVGLVHLSIGTSFQILRAAYLYAVQPFLLFWIFLGLVGHTLVDERLARILSVTPLFYIPGSFGIYGGGFASPVGVGVSFIWIGLCFGIVGAHRVLGRGDSHWITRLSEILWSTLLHINNLVYLSAAVLAALFLAVLRLLLARLRRPLTINWQPAEKEFRPMGLLEAFFAMMPGTLLGLFGLWAGWQNNVRWLFAVLPVLLGFMFSIPLVYFTARGSMGSES